ncbi:MAG: hypothetical protein M9899_07590 [Bdellovibrionaceae bacterium]|nr:hypothetical protein [Pseudobdellovibrionaceae bacterium]
MKHLFIFLVSAFPFIAHANYLKISGALGSKTTVQETTVGGSVDLEHTALQPLIVALGMSIGPVTLEIEGAIRENEDDSGGVGFTLQSQHLGLNIAADITGGKYMVNPYIGGGLTAGLYTIKPIDESGFGVSLQVFGGAMFKVTNFFHVGAEIRYMSSVRDIAFDIGGVEVEFEHKQTSYMLTTMLQF